MYPKIIYSLAILFFLFSCGSGPTGPIELSDGKKWKINVEMMPPIKSSEKLIAEFATSDQKDYKSLANQLTKNNKTLISSCTMKGKSHDELHKWLHPYMTLIDELGGSDSETEANQVFEKIEQSFETFNQYFE